MGLWTGYWEDWELYHDIIFDGLNKKIYINPNTSYLDVKNNLYSAWKEWTLLRDNLKYLPAFRSIGGDPIGGGLLAGDIYFLINNWVVVLDHTVNFYGALFSDDNPSPYEVAPNTYLSQATVSNLVLRTEAVTAPTGSGGLTPEQAAQLTQLVNLNTQQTSSLDNITTSLVEQSSSLYILNSITSEISSSSTSNTGQLDELLASSSLQSTALYDINQQNVQTSGSLATISTNIQTLLSTGGTLTPEQATMLLEVYRLMGLDPTKPLIVSPSTRDAGVEISQTIETAGDTVTVTRL